MVWAVSLKSCEAAANQWLKLTKAAILVSALQRPCSDHGSLALSLAMPISPIYMAKNAHG